jgi:hypothetical protein
LNALILLSEVWGLTWISDYNVCDWLYCTIISTACYMIYWKWSDEVIIVLHLIQFRVSFLGKYLCTHFHQQRHTELFSDYIVYYYCFIFFYFQTHCLEERQESCYSRRYNLLLEKKSESVENNSVWRCWWKCVHKYFVKKQ